MRDLLGHINAQLNPNNCGKYDIEKIDPDRDYLLPSNKIEVLLPRNQPIKDFVYVQQNNFSVITLDLVRNMIFPFFYVHDSSFIYGGFPTNKDRPPFKGTPDP